MGLKWNRIDWILVIALTLLASILRLYQIGIVPPGFQFDEAFNAIDALDVVSGGRPLFLPANAGREVLYTYYQAALVSFFGLNIQTLRLASAIAGILTAPATYLLLRAILRSHSRPIALFTSLTLVINLWHIHFSHYGIRVILMPLLFSVLFGCIWLSQFARTPWQRAIALVLAGIFTGVGVWTHPTGRLTPFMLIPFFAWLWYRYPERYPNQQRASTSNPLVQLAIIGTIAFIVFLPLGYDFYRNPDLFFGHASEVSVFADRVSSGSPLETLLTNVVHVAGMFSFRGDMEWTHNLANRPVFDPLLSIPFYIGLFLWGRRILVGLSSGRDINTKPPPETDPDVDALILLALWSVIMLLPSVFSEAAPNYSRTLPALPALFVAAGIGLTWLAGLKIPVVWFGWVAVTTILLVSASLAAYDYFVRFPAHPEVYYMYDADKLDALTYLQEQNDRYQSYLSQLWGDHHATVYFLRNTMGIKSLDTSDTIVLPIPGKGAIYAFPPEQEERAHQVASLWESIQPQQVLDSYGNLLLSNVEVEAERAADWPDEIYPTQQHLATFVDGPTLLGMHADSPDKQVTLFWQAEPMSFRSLTSFVHLIDADGRRVAQVDKLPGNGSYPTYVWSPDERIIDRYYPTLLDLCAAGEEVRVQVGWYELATGSQPLPRADSSGVTALAGTMSLPYLSTRAEELPPPLSHPLEMGPALNLLGYELRGENLQPGSPLVIDLYLQNTGEERDDALGETRINLTLTGATATSQQVSLWEDSIAPSAKWRANEVICRRVRSHIPLNAVPGQHTLQIALADTPAQTLATLDIGPSTHLFKAPPLRDDAGALLIETAENGGNVRLLGTTELEPLDSTGAITLPADALNLTLVWETLNPLQASYKTFVHLINHDGEIVAQSDSIPGQDVPTTHWLSGEVILDAHTLSLSPDLQPGIYHIIAGLYDPISNDRIEAFDQTDNRLPDDAVPLGTIELMPPISP